jgi:hypothetical protein
MNTTNNTNIATLANTLPKLKKDELVSRLVSYYTEQGLGSERSELGDLLAWFYKEHAPKINTKSATKDDYAWLWQAVASPKECRYYLAFVYCDGETLTATDGHRLHQVPNYLALEPGFYDKAKNKVHGTDWARYPEVRRVIPRVEDRMNEVTVDVKNLEIKGVDTKFQAALLPLPNDQKIGVNYKYLKQALAGDDLTTVQAGDSSESILYTSGKRLAVIMPMRV